MNEPTSNLPKSYSTESYKKTFCPPGRTTLSLTTNQSLVSSGPFQMLKVIGNPALSPNSWIPWLHLPEHFLHLEEICPSLKGHPESAHSSVFSGFGAILVLKVSEGAAMSPNTLYPWICLSRHFLCLERTYNYLKDHPESTHTCVFQSFLVLKVIVVPALSPNTLHPPAQCPWAFSVQERTFPSWKDNPGSCHTSFFSVLLSFHGV